MATAVPSPAKHALHRDAHYRPDIEGLRGIAVTMVVAYHLSPRRFGGGFIGVDVFFVLSGYLITRLLVREIEATGGLSLAGFYARRARRLLPASALVFLATILASTLFLSPLQQHRVAGSSGHTALYVSNFWFLSKASDYFSEGVATNPFLHTWSLAVEEQFYLVWPLLVLAGHRGRLPRTKLLAIMALTTVASTAAAVWFTRTLQPWAFFSPFSRAWEFAIGGLTLLLAEPKLAGRPNRGSPRLRVVVGAIGFVAIGAAGLAFDGQSGWPDARALLPVLGTAAVLLGYSPGAGTSKFLAIPALQFLGRLSYSWYLWHWPVLAISRAAHPNSSGSQNMYSALWSVGASLALAAATHVLVENPIRFSRLLAPRRTLTLCAAAILTFLSLGTAVLWQRSALQSTHAMDRGRILETLRPPDTPGAQCPPTRFLETAVSECVFGPVSSPVTVALFGDSHARQWTPAFEAVSQERGWHLVEITKDACPSAEVEIFNSALRRRYIECDTWREAAITRLIRMRPAAIVVSNRQLQNFSSGLRRRNDVWREATRRTLEKFDSAGIRTVLLRDTPVPKTDILDCLTGNLSWWSRWRASRRDPCNMSREQALNADVFRAEQDALAGLRYASLVDLSDFFCDGSECPPIRNDMIVYRDDSHISWRFARSLAPAVEDRVVSILGAP